jgi:hypothetical protein
LGACGVPSCADTMTHTPHTAKFWPGECRGAVSAKGSRHGLATEVRHSDA